MIHAAAQTGLDFTDTYPADPDQLTIYDALAEAKRCKLGRPHVWIMAWHAEDATRCRVCGQIEPD